MSQAIQIANLQDTSSDDESLYEPDSDTDSDSDDLSDVEDEVETLSSIESDKFIVSTSQLLKLFNDVSITARIVCL